MWVGWLGGVSRETELLAKRRASCSPAERLTADSPWRTGGRAHIAPNPRSPSLTTPQLGRKALQAPARPYISQAPGQRVLRQPQPGALQLFQQAGLQGVPGAAGCRAGSAGRLAGSHLRATQRVYCAGHGSPLPGGTLLAPACHWVPATSPATTPPARERAATSLPLPLHVSPWW